MEASGIGVFVNISLFRTHFSEGDAIPKFK